MKFALLVLLLLLGYYTYSCTCAPPWPNLNRNAENNPHQPYIDWADFIFVGRLISEKDSVYSTKVGESYHLTGTMYTFEIFELYKGKYAPRFINIYQYDDNCKYYFSINMVYIVLCSKEKVTNYCFRNKLYSDSLATDIKQTLKNIAEYDARKK